MSSIIQLHFDGTLCTEEHKVTLRTLSSALDGIQGAIDRAYLDVRFGNVYKHARLPYDAYDETDFIVGDPREGSLILDFTSLGTMRDVLKRVISAINDPYASARENGVEQLANIQNQIESRQAQIVAGIYEPKQLSELLQENDPAVMRRYGDKSISKEIDQMLAMVRRDPGARLDVSIKPSQIDSVVHYEFNQDVSKKFSAVLKQRQLGQPVICTGSLRELDHGENRRANFKGKFINSDNGKTVVIHIDSEDRFSAIKPHLGGGEFRIIACPIIEYKSFDPVAGDIQFIAIL